MNATPHLQSPTSHLHEPFLRRAAEPGEGRSGAHALGAFLTMRLVDQFSVDRPRPAPEALAYQIRATRDFLFDLQPREVEGEHLMNVVSAAEHAHTSGSVRPVWPAALAFAYWLESELRIDEARDVLETTLRLGVGDEPVQEQIAAHLQYGRVLRVAGQFDDSRATYVRAGNLARGAGDTTSEFRSRIGRALVSQTVGNLPEAERMLREVLDDARRNDDVQMEASALHDLANTLDLMGRPGEGIALAYRAFELYEQPQSRLRALSDLGILFKDLGNLEAAHDAFMLVVESNPPLHMRLITVNELIEIAGLRRDRLAFERWRREAERADRASPYLAADTELKIGIAYAQLGYAERAEKHLESVIALAEEHDLNQFVFRAEAALADIRRGSLRKPEPEKASLPASSAPEIGTVAERLAGLRLAQASVG